MLISDGENFVSVISKFLTALNYGNTQEHSGKPYDITAENDEKKICFKCHYDIDAIGAVQIETLHDAVKGAGFDKTVYITNSSFSPAAKKKAEEYSMELWDRNILDRMSIGIRDTFEERPVEVKKSRKGMIVIAGVAVAAVAAAVYYYFFR